MSDALYRSEFHWHNTRQRMIDNGNSPCLLRKVCLRIVTGLLAIVGAGLFAAAIKPWETNFIHTKGPIKGAWQDALPILPLAVSAIYNIPVAYYCLWYAKRACTLLEVVIDFIVWAVLIPGLVFAIWGGSFRLWREPTIGPHGEILCMGMNMFSPACLPALYQVGKLELAGVVFGALVWVMTTFLFIHGCVETIRHRRRGTAAFDRAAFMDLERASGGHGAHRQHGHHRIHHHRRRRHHDRRHRQNSPSDVQNISPMGEKTPFPNVRSSPEFSMPRLPVRAMPRYG